MASTRYLFGEFTIDCDQRILLGAAGPVPLNARYFDALALLVENAGSLISKDRFNEEVWRSMPVTDEALTQCIRSLRAALGDKARDPRFIETVPKHGYRFVGEVRREEIADGPSPKRSAEVAPLHKALALLWRAMIGGTGAGIIGGVLYGMIGLPGAPGALSALLVMVALCGVVGVLAGLGVGAGLGIAAYFAPHSRAWQVGGAALGGGLVGATSELLGVDAFTLLFGRAPSDMTGLPEGLALGCAIGCALLVRPRESDGRRSFMPIALAVPLGLVSGAMIAFAGGRLMAGSLEKLAEAFGDSRIGLGRIAAMFGEQAFGPLSLAFTTAFEAMLFVTMVVAAIRLLPDRRETRTPAGDAGRYAGSV